MSLFSKIVPALFVSALLIVPAAAVPVGPNLLSSESSVIQVRKDGDGKGRHSGNRHRSGGKHHRGSGRHHGGNKWHGGGHRGGKWHGHRGGRWVAGQRYRSAPGGWRRYGARPWDWQTRGCVLVGPIWFCP